MTICFDSCRGKMYTSRSKKVKKQKLLEVKAHVTVRPGCVRHQGGGGHGRKWRSSHHLRRLQLGMVQSCVPTGAGRLPVGLLHPNSAGCAEAGAQRWRRELALFSHLEVVVTVQLLTSSNTFLLYYCTSEPRFSCTCWELAGWLYWFLYITSLDLISFWV